MNTQLSTRPEAPRAQSRSEPRVAVIGAGMSGILMGIRLQQAGITSFTIYEKADRIGGTWRENTYPGLACDVPAHMYTYSFEPNPEWNSRFAEGAQIQQYFERVYAKHKIGNYTEFNREVVNAVYNDGCWDIEFADGTMTSADFLITACGVLHHPSYPNIEGLDTFAGDMFHSARWDHDVDLKGKKVGLVGTGSTSAQIVPAIVDEVAQLTLFQRTAQWMIAAPNKKYSEKEKQRLRRFPLLSKFLRYFYSRAFELTFARAVTGHEKMLNRLEANCRQNLKHNVKDPSLREKLTPDYKAACKRLIFSNTFYPAIQKPNAELVVEGIERIEPRGLVTKDGRLHELDVLVLATGFQAHNFMRPMSLTGRDGLTLQDAWANGPRAHRSVAMPGFPNFFMLVGPNSPIGNYSLISSSELQANYILELIKKFRKGRFAAIEPSEAATERFNASVSEAMKTTVWITGCKSWYFDEAGNSALWPWSFAKFRKEMKKPDLAEFVLTS